MKLPEVGPEAQVAIRRGVDRKDPISNLEQLGIGQRMINLFQLNRINHMGELMNARREELLKMNNFGERQLHKLFAALSNYHLLED
jgi:DNA-directed RNA polymerase alpha subunit